MAHPASESALGPMTIIAAEQYEPEAERIVHDELAYYVLPPGIRRVVRLARWRPMRNLLMSVTEKTAHGIWASMLCRKRFIDGITMYGAAPTYRRFREQQQLWHFGLDPQQVPAFLSEYGWEAIEHLGSAELTARYITPSGRAMPVSEIERIVSAVKR